MNLKLVLAKEEVLGEIARLARVTWNDHYPGIVGQQQVDYMLAKIYSHDSMIDQMRNKGQQFYFIVWEGEHIGFLGLSHDVDSYETFIHKFYILGTKQKAGLGSEVMELIYDLFPGTSHFRLTVNRQNYKSINFYFKNGFKIESVADFDIGNGYFMNDFIMVKQVL